MIWLLWLPVTLAAPKIFPLVDPGLFVISGVKTCGGGGGYCLLGLDCTLDEDFLPDNEAGQHCEGLKSAFTPSAHFVCCRATNKTVYKPPIVFPSVLTTANTEPMTARTTTLNVLENEIDQVLQKVAQSVNAVKKPPVTEATVPQADETDKTSELRESPEESLEDDDEMVADSPEEELWQDMSDEDDHLEDINTGILEEEKAKDSVTLKKPIQSSIPLIKVPYKPKPLIEETSVEKSSEENTISPGSISKESATDEIYLDENVTDNEDNNSEEKQSGGDKTSEENLAIPTNINGDTPVTTNKNLTISQNNNYLQEGHVQDQTKGNTEDAAKEDESQENYKDEMISVPNLDEIPSSTPISENSVGNNKYGDKPLQDSISQDTINADGPSDDNLIPNTTSKLNTEEQLSKNETTKTNEETPTKISETTNLLSAGKNHTKQENPASSLNTIPTESVTSTGNKTIENVESNNTMKEHNTLPSTGTISTDIGSEANNTTVTDENQLVTSTSVSPVTQTLSDNQPISAQGQPTANEPCGKEDGKNCTQEVKFALNNQTMCFGSVYSLDWIVTSASCALKIFRAGMLNVDISPLIGTSLGHVKTIVVHESYAENSGPSGQGMEANNIGLVQLQTLMTEWSSCVPCLPDAGQDFAGTNCSAVTSLPLAPAPPHPCPGPEECQSARSDSLINSCEGPGRVMRDDMGFTYITLNCDTLWEPRYYDPSARGSGAPLFCGNGVLSGVEASAGLGLMVYTPLSPYLPWLLKNTRPGLPEQNFNVG